MAARESSMGGMAAIRSTLYSLLLKRNSVYVGTCVVAGFVGTNMYLSATDSLWKKLNKGKSWEEVRVNLPEKVDDDDDDD